jgi:uncharacterized repeat protein (TIGR01451 family)
VSLLATPTQVTNGQIVTYTISVTDFGPTAASGIVLANVLDPAMTFVDLQGGVYSINGQTVTVTLPNSIGVGGTATVTLRAQAPAIVTGPLVDSVSVRANEIDPDPSNNSASLAVAPATADLAISLLGANFIATGQTNSYVISVTNNGPDTATGIIITNVLDPAMSFLSCKGDGSCAANGGNILITLNSPLGAGAGATIILSARAGQVSGAIVDSATVRANEIDPDLSNNSATSTAAALLVSIRPNPNQSGVPPLHSFVLSWPATGTNTFFVEACDRLPGNWQRLTNAPTVSGGLATMTINATNNARFFRLRSQ